MKTNKKEEGVRRQKQNSNFDERGLVWEPKKYKLSVLRHGVNKIVALP
jgi:hypothetical protein